MARYVISDHHFGHANIIEYTNRPFSSPGQMDDELLDRHYETVDPEDTLIHLGDVAMDMQDGKQTIEFFRRLDGDILLRGNHDVGVDADETPFPILEACVLDHEEYRFYCTHRPEDVPEWWDGWVLHGHIHNNDTDTYTFVAYDAQRVNVGCELLNYRPMRLGTITSLLDAAPAGTNLRDVDAAKEHFE
jgi:calcineurin-like phosphoesterase family protein